MPFTKSVLFACEDLFGCFSEHQRLPPYGQARAICPSLGLVMITGCSRPSLKSTKSSRRANGPCFQLPHIVAVYNGFEYQDSAPHTARGLAMIKTSEQSPNF